MSKVGILKKENIERLKHFLEHGVLNKSSERFKIRPAAYRECIVETTKELELQYGYGNFIGNINHTKDIYVNSIYVMRLIDSFNKGIENSSNKRISSMTKKEFSAYMVDLLNKYFNRL